MSAPERFDDLASRCLEGLLTPSEEKEFFTLLNDPQHRRAFAEIERINLELLGTLAAPLPDEEMLRLVMKDARGIPASGSTQRAQAVMDRVHVPSARRATRKRRERTSPWALPLGLAAMVGLVLGTVILLRANTPALDVVAHVIASEGEAFRIRQEQQSTLKNGDEIAVSDALRLSADGRVEFKYNDGTRVTLRAGTQLQVPSSSGKQLHITSGTLSASVTPQPAGQPMRVTSPHAEALVVGTRLNLDVRKGSTRLDVEDGKVRFTTNTRQSVDVSAGEYSVAAPDMSLTVRSIKPPAPPASEMAWESLFKSPNLQDWKTTRGAARVDDGVVVLAGKDASRIESIRHFPAVEIEGELRLTGAHLAEFQIEGYLWFFQIDLTPKNKNKGEWHSFKASFKGQAREAWLDGAPLALERGDGEGPPGGPIAFYVTYGGKLELRGMKVRVPVP